MFLAQLLLCLLLCSGVIAEQIFFANTSASNALSCRLQQLRYFRLYWRSAQYRSDNALSHMWTKFERHWENPCGIGGPTAIIDVGAHTGEELEYCLRAFGPGRGCTQTKMYLYEPNPLLANRLRATVKRLVSASSVTAEVTVRNNAVSNVLGIMYFTLNDRSFGHKSNDPMWMQTGYLTTSRAKAKLRGHYTRVNVTTLNDDFGSSSFTYFPLVKIDTEGFDATVIFGSSKLLERVGVYVFECHKLWIKQGSGHSLKSVVTWFAERNFQVFKVGHPYFIRLSPPYWHAEYDSLLTWHNCLAVRPNSPLLAAMRTLC
eukprot:TRINITY_DN6225_c0_g1_i1.p1 TRINITY_DN6225_c0_g1~~TRINITY_DN6225_c0_g1_i1.p1  ORF type:complete len:316 (+),score=41.18 TRINITY_DN6225_c0_g1_i1:41-988(+)